MAMATAVSGSSKTKALAYPISETPIYVVADRQHATKFLVSSSPYS